MKSALIRLVWQRARGCCEYCRMPQSADDAPFEIDHVISRKRLGPTIAGNMCISCVYYNSFNDGTDKLYGGKYEAAANRPWLSLEEEPPPPDYIRAFWFAHAAEVSPDDPRTASDIAEFLPGTSWANEARMQSPSKIVIIWSTRLNCRPDPGLGLSADRPPPIGATSWPPRIAISFSDCSRFKTA